MRASAGPARPTATPMVTKMRPRHMSIPAAIPMAKSFQVMVKESLLERGIRNIVRIRNSRMAASRA